MNNFLVGHALRHVWCSPSQDMQVIFKPMKINRPSGSIVSGPHLWSRLTMPTRDGYYHLYQIGQLTPYLIGLLPYSESWVRFSDVMASEKLIANLYVNNGLQLPNTTSYYMFTEERNLILAVKDQPLIADLRYEPLYLRLYSNAFFHSVRALDYPHRVYCEGTVMTSTTVGEYFQAVYHQYQAKDRGYTWLFVNGRLMKDFVPSLTAVGSILELVYDSSVKQVVDYPIATAPNFDSDLDGKRKYLLHHTGAQVDGPVIDYRDDIDFYLLRPYMRGTVPMFEGVYFHKNQNDAVRMVTHRDYAIAVPYVVNYQLQHSWPDVHALTARAIIRHSGWQRPLVDEHHRIKELYRLPSDEVIYAMHGTEATVPVWQAASLENSFYTKIMDAYGPQIDLPMVYQAYGYNASAKLLADTPQKIELVNGRKQVDLPPGLHERSTVYEFDKDGHLVETVFHTLGAQYTPLNTKTKLIEAIVGRALPYLNVTVDTLQQDLDPALNYRFYRAVRVGDQILHDSWQDVTGDTSCYSMIGDKAVWSLNLLNWTTLVIDDKDFVGYELELAPANGLLKFSINVGRPNAYIPPGKIDLWLNGKALIEDLDYFVKWPEIVICNKEYLNRTTKQTVTVRCTGFCRSDLTRESAAERGFVKHGALSRNGYWNIRDDKVVRIIVKGATYHRSDLTFVEDEELVKMPESMNGFPYLVENVVIPIRNLTDGMDTYSFRQASLVVDQQVADYLNEHLHEPFEANPNMSFERYMIYSPFSSTIIHDLANGILSMDQFKGHYSDNDVLETLEPYRYLLDYDPTQKNLDPYFVSIHPHNLLTEVPLDIYQYNFLSRAVRIFLDDKVDLSRFVVIV